MGYAGQQVKSNGLKQELKLQRRIIFGNKRYWFHIVLWLLAFLYLVVALGDISKGFLTGAKFTSKEMGNLDMGIISAGLISGCLVAAIVVYSFLLLAIPFARYKMQKRYLWLALLANGILWLAVVIGVAAIIGYVQGFSGQEKGAKNLVLFLGIFGGLSLMLTANFFSFYYFIDLYDQQKGLNRYQQVFTDKLQAETNFLKTQINPHFLFNTLNNIYSLTLSKSDDAPRITAQLKELISYMVNDCALDMVPLSGEVNFLRNYIALEQLRNRQDNTIIELEVKGNTEGREIAPLLLVNFIENAFKHGVKSDTEQSFVKVRLYIMDKVLALEVSNSKPATAGVKDLEVKHSGGIGIRNVKRRLEILYPNRHRLRINQTHTTYNVYLHINL